MYSPLRPFRTETISVRHLDYHVRVWGEPSADTPPLLLVHGWMDVGASYQFVVDALSEAFFSGRHIIAPDWRGFGLSRPAVTTDSYHFVDYLADLDVLLNHYAGDRPVDLVGHSMGGNVSMSYSGARPQRIRRLVNLEGFGMPVTRPTQAPKRLGQWLDQLGQQRAGEMELRGYNSLEAVAQRLQKTNPRLPADKAQWLASHWSERSADGQWRILGDSAHKVVSAHLAHVEEQLALYAAITAPVLAVEASDDSMSKWWKNQYDLPEYHQRLTHIAQCRIAVVQDAGHMLHHDQPEITAQLIEAFLQQ